MKLASSPWFLFMTITQRNRTTLVVIEDFAILTPMTPAPSPPSCIAPKPSIIRTSLLREVSHSQEQEQQQHISLTGATVVSSPGSMSRHSCEKCHLATSQIQADKKIVGTYFANGRSALSEACNRRNTPIQIANDDRTNFIRDH